MATLDPDRERKLRTALRTCELRLRNWSTPGEWVFAIYEDHGDAYVGTVRLHDDGVLRVNNSRYGHARREREKLEALCREHARIASC